MPDHLKMPSRLEARHQALIQTVAAETMERFGEQRAATYPIVEAAAASMLNQIYEEDAELRFLRTFIDKMLERQLAHMRLMTNMAHPAVMMHMDGDGIRYEPIPASKFYAQPGCEACPWSASDHAQGVCPAGSPA